MKTLVKNNCKAPAKRVQRTGKGRKLSREEAHYWGLWSEIFAKFNIPKSQQSEWRKDIRIQVLGSDRTQATFSHADYDLVLGAMRELLAQDSLVIYPGKLIDMYAEGQTRRVMKLIKDLDMPEAYTAKVALNRFHTNNWKMLTLGELFQLYYTLKSRKTAADKKGTPIVAKQNAVSEQPPQSTENNGFVEADEDEPF